MIEEVTRDFVPRWCGQAPFIETWCATLNHLSSGAGFWIRYTIVAPRRAPARAEVWFASFTPGRESASAALGRSFSADEIEAAADSGDVRIGPCLLEPEGMTGMLASEGIPVAWELHYRPVTDSLHCLPGTTSGASRTDLVVPYPFMLAAGKIHVRDHQYVFNGDPGQLSHYWGPATPVEWTWFHCSAFVEENGDPIPAYVTGASRRDPLLPGVAAPPASFGHLVWKERHFFLRPRDSWRDRQQGDWAWGAESGEESVAVLVSIPREDTVAAEHRGPAGPPVVIRHTGLATCSVRISSPRRAPALFTASRLAHAQIASPRGGTDAPRRLRML